MTHERIQDVLRVARENYDCIASLADAIALLDMCHCFADNVASSRLPCCRPVLSDHGQSSNHGDATVGGGGAIAIRNGRYAIDVSSTGVSASGGDFIPNDTYSSALQNFTVITGINGSGKSTYLKQIALIVILAHCGSYVPADEAFLPVRDQICTRIGTSDDQEHNISTFLLEMKETAFICNSTTDRSLFLLDELGRATSNEDGVALAWAVSEYLLTKRAMVSTAYEELSFLST
jgi:DNA mismatch repair ATPase MutS